MGILLDTLYGATLLPHYLWHRLKTDKYGRGAPEKLGKLNITAKSPGQKRLWLHAVSVGETISAKPLIELFKAEFPDWDIKISTTTRTGREVAVKNFGIENVFYYPLDIRRIVNHTFDQISPDLIILMELEVWPHFLEIAEDRKVPVAVSNVRITDKSYRNFKKLGQTAARVLNKISLWASQSTEYSDILKDLGVAEKKIHTVGSLKYDGLDFSEKPERVKQLQGELGGGRIFLAGSTHEGEDEIVLQAFENLRNEFGKELKLVLVPRHPERCDSVIKLIPQKFKYFRRSEGRAPEETDIIIGDTMGELADMYRAAEIVFIAGSLSEKVGGHNMLEPAAFGKPVIYGPHTFNFKEPAARLEQAGGAVKLSDTAADSLKKAAADLLNNPDKAADIGSAAQKACSEMQGTGRKTIELLKNIIGSDEAENG
ncbi:MAG: 3-deoxy-D-manno-octulosonic acid transferase [Planctomycetota bacterium]|jgi:3-deoxy-D-manno-octulosonic-acid transferase